MIDASPPGGDPLRDSPDSSKNQDCRVEELFSTVAAMNRSLATFKELPVFKNERLEAVQWLVLMAILREPVTNAGRLFDTLGILPHRVHQVLQSLKEARLVADFSLTGDRPTMIVPSDAGNRVLARVNAALVSANSGPTKESGAELPRPLDQFASAPKKKSIELLERERHESSGVNSIFSKWSRWIGK